MDLFATLQNGLSQTRSNEIRKKIQIHRTQALISQTGKASNGLPFYAITYQTSTQKHMSITKICDTLGTKSNEARKGTVIELSSFQVDTLILVYLNMCPETRTVLEWRRRKVEISGFTNHCVWRLLTMCGRLIIYVIRYLLCMSF